ncbi:MULTISPECIES: hypothetical protein [unclassified Mycobacterium]|uniref:hypothetical protein n=1 Tax=unclassified Mycobacterium TaxID=2642494 RepID=UPI0029C8257B|nr:MULTISPECIES: hypothetical protein [unclassified Mycobacterium]
MTSLETKMQKAGGPVPMLRDAPVGAYPFPIRSEYTNWRDEQESWRRTAALMDSSFHMTDFYFKGPDVKKLLSDTGVNSFAKFGPNKAKQFVALNYDGYVIADAILTCLDEDEVVLVGRAAAPNWVAYHAETGGYDVEVGRDYQSALGNNERKLFRYQLQGPNAYQIAEKVNGGPLEPIQFFGIGEVTIAGVRVRAHAHSMSREVGFEFSGPAADGPAVKEALITAGEEFGLRLIGARAYPSMCIESGWIPSPTPAIYSGEQMKPYREWLSASTWEANASLGGSFYSDDIEDYYQTVWDLGLERLVKFDHEFIGRSAVEAMWDRPHRRKVWLRWNDEDAARILAESLFNDGDRAKYPDLPVSNYSTLSFDRVHLDGRLIGLSTTSGYSANLRGWSSLAMVDESAVSDGVEVNIAWGEEHGGSAKPTVERHVQAKLRATMSTTPLVT